MSLVGWWPLHDGANGTATDYSGNGNHGTMHGPTPGVVGRGGLQAMHFDGSSHIDLGDVGLEGSESFTASAWVKPASIPGSSKHGIFYNGGSSANDTFYLSYNYNGTLIVDVNSSSVYFSGGTVEVGKWSFVTFTYDDSTSVSALYVDGEVTNMGGTAGAVNSTAETLKLGGRDDKAKINGVLSGARVYNRALTQSEIRTLYEWGSADLARPPTDGTAYYPLDGGATDAWGDNDGTTSGSGVTWVDGVRGQAASFDGSASYIEITPQSLSEFTVSMFLNASSLTGNSNDWALAIGESGTKDNFLGARTSDDVWRFRPSDGSNLEVSAARTLRTNEWHHMTFIYDGAFKVYQNGELVGATSNTGKQLTIDALGVGYSSDSYAYNGVLDDVRIYDYALEPHEVHDLYQWGTRGRDLRSMVVTA